MSFAKIAEARAVKKIVAFIRAEAEEDIQDRINAIADDIEGGRWKDVKLSKPKKKARKR